MRRRVVEYPRGGIFRGRELPRLLTMLCFLLVLGMMMYRSSDPNAWKWLAPAGEERRTAEKTEKKPSKPEPTPVASGPTDLDPDEAQLMANNRQAISDRTTYIQPEEMLAYNQVVRWVHNQPWAMLEKRAKKGVIYDQLVADPEKFRLAVVAWDLDVRLIREWSDLTGPGGERLYEVWGMRSDSGNRLYDAMVIDLPKEMHVGKVWEKAKVVGYFLKLQAYEPGDAKPNARPLLAPLLIGRMKWQPTVIPPVKSSDWTWGLVAVAALIVVAAVLGFAMMGRDRQVALAPLALSGNPDAPSLDEWLRGEGESEECPPGNKISENGDSKHGESNQYGAGGDNPPSSPGDFGRIER